MTAALEAPSILYEVEQLPDGRELHVYPDGSIVVSGRAEIRPHPVEGVTWITRTPARTRTRRRPRTRIFTSALPVRTIWPSESSMERVAARRTAHERARELLLSLLNPFQREDYVHHSGFWVETARGRIRLGRLYNLEFRPKEKPYEKQILCVLPVNHETLPLPDIWTNLLLVLNQDPDKFFRVAVRR